MKLRPVVVKLSMEVVYWAADDDTAPEINLRLYGASSRYCLGSLLEAANRNLFDGFCCCTFSKAEYVRAATARDLEKLPNTAFQNPGRRVASHGQEANQVRNKKKERLQ